MQSEDDMKEDLAAALRGLAEEDCGLEAPPHVEARLIRAFRQKQAHRRWRNGMIWSLAAAAVFAVVLVGINGRQRAADPVQETQPARYVPPPRVTVLPPQVAEADPPQVESQAAGRVAPAARRSPLARQAPPRSREANVPAREVVTEFFPLLDAAPPFERGELLRVTVPASTMRKVGLPVNQDRLADRVYADVLVGEEGLARAIRFVSYEQ